MKSWSRTPVDIRNLLRRSHSILTLGEAIIHDEATDASMHAANFLAINYFFFALVLPLGVSASLSVVGALLLSPSSRVGRVGRFTRGTIVLSMKSHCGEQHSQGDFEDRGQG